MPGRGWQSYDSIADAYGRVWHPKFEHVARDLIELVEVPADATVLDVGTGTGVVAAEAARKASQGVVVGIDPSVNMLAIGRTNAPLAPVAGRSPGLPFAGRTFDTVVANLVLSHFEQYDSSLADVVRILRPGGRLGATTWGSLDDDPVDDGDQRELTAIWKSVAGRFVDADVAADAIDAAIPWEGWFGESAHLRGALERSGLRGVALHARTYRLDVTQLDMLTGYETSFWGRYVRHALSEEDWTRLRHEVEETARAALPDPISRVDQLLIGVGTKAFDTRP